VVRTTSIAGTPNLASLLDDRALSQSLGEFVGPLAEARRCGRHTATKPTLVRVPSVSSTRRATGRLRDRETRPSPGRSRSRVGRAQAFASLVPLRQRWPR
jgi:hypothetical protein